MADSTVFTTSKDCVVCGKPSTNRCSRCKLNYYCSTACQTKDWKTHKVGCTPAGPVISTATPPPKSLPSSESPATTTSAATISPSASTATTGPTLPDPSTILNVEPVTQPTDKEPVRKKVPQAKSTILKFQYQPSHDGVDTNLVFFFHGLGDKIEPSFVKLAASLKLPQTATICVQAALPVPYLEEEGWQWFPSFNNLNGELLGPECPERLQHIKQVIRPELVKLLKHCIDFSGFKQDNIILFGFSQGGQVALDLAAFGGVRVAGVLTVAGYMMEETRNDKPVLPGGSKSTMDTDVMILQGETDEVRSLNDSKYAMKYIERIFGKSKVEQRVVAGMSHGMPDSEEGWYPLMEFFANHLKSRNVAMESMSDVYHVRP